MRLKGKTLIELTDVNTGETESYKDENIITNAIPSLFGDNINGMFLSMKNTNAYTNWDEYNLPICPNAMGGILLFSDTIEEDENTLYAPSTNPIVGYSSNNVSTTDNPLRGSMNQSESCKVEDGYKFVFDFQTSQGNGTIASICLTHKRGGIGYFGDTYNSEYNHFYVRDVAVQQSGTIVNKYIDAVEVDFDGNYVVSISMDTGGVIHIVKFRCCLTKLGLTYSLNTGEEDTVLEDDAITPSIFIPGNKSSPCLNFFDGEDGYYYGFTNETNYSNSSEATVKWIKIKKDDKTFTEGTWTFSKIYLQQCGYRSSYGATNPSRINYSAFMGGYVYFLSYDKASVYKINANNPADITRISLGFTSNSSGSNYSNNYLYRVGDWIFAPDFRINSNDEVTQIKHNSYHLEYACTPLFQKGVYALTFGYYAYGTTTIRKRLWVICPYLASINNLETAVIKTADKTMKITYTVTEESD